MDAYYLHQIEIASGRHIILVDHNPITRDTYTLLGGEPIVYADGTPVKSTIGWTLGPVTSRNEAQTLALTIAKRYNWDVEMDGQLLGLPYSDRREAAAALGAATSEAKAAASRSNGKRGGRPKRAE